MDPYHQADTPMRFNLSSLSKSHALLARFSYTVLGVTGLTLLILVQSDYNHAIESCRKSHESECKNEFIGLTNNIERALDTIYHDLRMIARLPGVYDLDPAATGIEFHGGRGMESNALASIQEVYNSLASTVAVSELYIVPASFNPDAHPDESDAAREPWVTFDHLILGRSRDHHLAQDAEELEELGEIEVHEYRLIRRQLAWFKQHYPNQDRITGLQYPALSGPEVVTCDNRYYSANDPDDANRKGMVISVPFYGPNGELRGCVSAVILTRVLREMLPNGDYVITEPKYGYFIQGEADTQNILSREHASLGVPDRRLLCSMAQDLNTHDARDGWKLWVGHSDEHFWNRQDVATAGNARTIGFGFVLIFLLTAGPGTWLILNGRKKLDLANHCLQDMIREQTIRLEHTLDELKTQTAAIDQHAGVLVTDARGTITQVNRKMCELSGYDRHERVNQHWKILDAPNQSKQEQSDIWGQLARGLTWQGELNQRAKDGCHYTVNSTTVPILDATGTISQFISVRTDISKYKPAKKTLQRETRESA